MDGADRSGEPADRVLGAVQEPAGPGGAVGGLGLLLLLLGLLVATTVSHLVEDVVELVDVVGLDEDGDSVQDVDELRGGLDVEILDLEGRERLAVLRRHEDDLSDLTELLEDLLRLRAEVVVVLLEVRVDLGRLRSGEALGHLGHDCFPFLGEIELTHADSMWLFNLPFRDSTVTTTYCHHQGAAPDGKE